jgi:hypothetical protein
MVSIELEPPDIDPMTITRVSGVDVGRRYLAVETDLQKNSKFYCGKEARHKANRYQKARKTLHCKGTPSATRRLIAISGMERRFTADVNHTISKQIAKPNSLIGLENLNEIRTESSPERVKGLARSTVELIVIRQSGHSLSCMAT